RGTGEERAKSERLVRARTAPVRLVSRARIIPRAAAGMRVPTIAQQLELSGKCVRLWLARFNQAAWLNLIEGFLKILRQRALAGRVCSTTEEVDQALQAGVADWNRRPTGTVARLEPSPDSLPLEPSAQTPAPAQATICLLYLRNDALSI